MSAMLVPQPNQGLHHINKTNIMKSTAIYYHAGCPVCVDAEKNVVAALDPQKFNVEIVHLGEQKSCVTEAERSGVKSVPALVFGGQAFHINFGAGLDALK
jgi:hypothetical protein